ncbi:YfcC family protein [Sporosarcina limicola]|uniref:Ion transporter superfamily protein YfcC n=1 Tax=Sporosarcina limicola TaxID=34101 RepID=A0A927MKR7_9BACL|nr:AbgT family transporter [Sporosarcina limicola]MBE1556549.1 putative ion transporter superfamily protein YfcC [Sporosarcina limicola]
MKDQEKKKFTIPHTYAIIFFIVILAMVATYLVPAGEYERELVNDKQVVIANSYTHIENSPVTPFGLFTAIPLGMQKGAQIIFYIFLVGGAFGIIRATGAIESGVNRLVTKMENHEKLLIPIIMIMFSILGFTTGMSEETIIFVPIGIAVARALGYDAIVGTAMVSTGAASGFIGGMMNPFTVGVAQGIAEIPLFSGFLFRSVVYVFVLSIAILYVTHYAKKVKADKRNSIIYDLEIIAKRDPNVGSEFAPFTKRHALALLTLFFGVGINMYGVFKWDWFLNELAASFIIVGFVAGLIGGLGINKTFDSFVEGMKMVAFGALIVGFARAILVVLESGVIIDSLIYYLASAISNLPATLNVLGMFVIQVIFNFFIPSGSGQAATTMPIMVPLADLLGIERQVAVLAFQYGDSISNSIIPTSAALMGYLAVAQIPYERWVKFIWKLIVIWLLVAAIALVVAVWVGVS